MFIEIYRTTADPALAERIEELAPAAITALAGRAPGLVGAAAAPSAITSARGTANDTRAHSDDAGRWIQKIDPCGLAGSTPTCPSIASARCLTIASPRPVPPTSRERPLSTR